MAAKIFSLALLTIFLGSATAFAECDICKAANEQQPKDYVQGVGAKVVQGSTNAGFSWLELFLQPVKVCNDAGKKYVDEKQSFHPMECAGTFLYGIASGVGSTGYRAGTGVGEILSALCPQRVMPATDCEACQTQDMKAKGYVS